MSVFLLALTTLSQVVEPAQSAFQRQRQNHTIYTVRGSADQLKQFQDQIGSSWKGGVLLDAGGGSAGYRYWAFAQRTAPQARQFIFGSMMSGLQIDMKAYDEKASFPVERAAFDAIVAACSLKTDPFFITPQREVRLERAEDKDACAERKLATSDSLKDLQPSAPTTEQNN